MNGPAFPPPDQGRQKKSGKHHRSGDELWFEEQEQGGCHQGDTKSEGSLDDGTETHGDPRRQELHPVDVRDHGGGYGSRVVTEM